MSDSINDMRRNLMLVNNAEISRLEGVYSVAFSEEVLEEMKVQAEKRMKQKVEMHLNQNIGKDNRIYIQKIFGLRVNENGTYSADIVLGDYKRNKKVIYFTKAMMRGNIGETYAYIWPVT